MTKAQHIPRSEKSQYFAGSVAERIGAIAIRSLELSAGRCGPLGDRLFQFIQLIVKEMSGSRNHV